MPYRVINIYYSVTCYTNHINSTRIQSIASMALMVFPDAQLRSHQMKGTLYLIQRIRQSNFGMHRLVARWVTHSDGTHTQSDQLHSHQMEGTLCQVLVIAQSNFGMYRQVVRRPKANLGQTTTLGDSEREGRIGLDCLSVNPKRAQMGSLLVLDCTLYILEYMWAA